MCHNQTRQHDSYDHALNTNVLPVLDLVIQSNYIEYLERKQSIVTPEDKSEKVPDFQKHNCFHAFSISGRSKQ